MLPLPLTTPDHYTFCHHTVNRTFMDDLSVNLKYSEVIELSPADFDAWMGRVRAKILQYWDKKGIPPRVGLSEHDIQTAIGRIDSADMSKIWIDCDDGGAGLLAPATSHGFIAQWFPTMMKTRINYSKNDNGFSVYDIFARDDIWARYLKTYAFRHFRRDSFFAYTRSIHRHEALITRPDLVPKSVVEYMDLLLENPVAETVPSFDAVNEVTTYGLLFTPLDNADKQDYTGYSTKMKDVNRSVWWITAAEAVALRDSGKYPAHWFVAVTDTNKRSHYILRLYDSNIRIFPDGFKPFRISICQYAVNWPSLAARALYEKYTQGIENPVIYDPSAGWGGRMIGAISARGNPTYIACDPNADHVWTDDFGVEHSKYTELAAYYSDMHPMDESRAKVLFFPCGSEEIRHSPIFKQYRGKVNVAFTSPPYFNREVYSEDAEQSAKKFSGFDDWCEGFLKPTIETAAEWLAPGGYLFWNIADIKHGTGNYLPLEARSIEYATKAGLIQGDTIRLLMTNMPGANRIDPEGKGTARNTCLVNGRVNKFEPIFSFRKP